MVMSPITRSCSHKLSKPKASARTANLRMCSISVGPSKKTCGSSMPQGKWFAIVSQLLDIILVHHKGHAARNREKLFPWLPWTRTSVLRITIAPYLRGLRKLSEDAPQSSQKTRRKRQRKEICETISECLSLASVISVSSVVNAPNFFVAAPPRWVLRGECLLNAVQSRAVVPENLLPRLVRNIHRH